MLLGGGWRRLSLWERVFPRNFSLSSISIFFSLASLYLTLCQQASYSICASATEGGKHLPGPPSASGGSAGSPSLPLNGGQEILDIGLPLLLSGGPGDTGPIDTSARVSCLLLQVLLVQAVQASQVQSEDGVPHQVLAVLPLFWVFSQRELAFPRTFKNLHLLVV